MANEQKQHDPKKELLTSKPTPSKGGKPLITEEENRE